MVMSGIQIRELDVTAIFAEQALLPEGWQANVRIAFDGGRIAAVEAGAAPQAGDERHAILLPGMPNLHSHAFQRGMAGLAELRGPSADSFWSWREVMYRYALSMTPDQVEAVAAQLYVEMLEAGFSRVGEFHYLHHDRDGKPYANIAEMAERIAAAAGDTGIGLTLLPVFYAHSAFGGAAPNEGQRRFINHVGQFGRLLEKSRESVSRLEEAVVGVAPHSLRAVTLDELRQLEYSQRLAHRARNVLARAGGSTGRALFDAALDGGSVALGAGPSQIAAGGPADFVSLDGNHPSLAGKFGDAILDAWIFANGGKVDCVWVHGKKQVSGGRHAKREAVAKRFREVMTALSQG